MKNKISIILMIFLWTLRISPVWAGGVERDTSQPAKLSLVFVNQIQGQRVLLRDPTYVNPFGEQYTINKLRYYVSHISLSSASDNYTFTQTYLINQAKEDSRRIQLELPAGTYNGIHFLLGVDSLHNVSGAQTGALDPTKDMFWTWNTGYVMLKMEGQSPASPLVNHKYEFHTGGFSGPWSVLQHINLDFKNPLSLPGGQTIQLIINADINDLWEGAHSINIAEHANITAPGKLAQSLSENYARMFSLGKIKVIE